jgi:hypothetical protein
MPDQLYRRCPDCRESGSRSSCPTCGGERFIPAGVAPNDIAALARRDSRRWRFRISTLMLLVVIAALLSYIDQSPQARSEPPPPRFRKGMV